MFLILQENAAFANFFKLDCGHVLEARVSGKVHSHFGAVNLQGGYPLPRNNRGTGRERRGERERGREGGREGESHRE